MSDLKVALAVAENPPQNGVGILLDKHRSLGHDAYVLDLSTVSVGPGLQVQWPGTKPDVVHSRASALWSVDVLAAVETQVPVYNSASASYAGRDKWVCYQKLCEAGISGIPSMLMYPHVDVSSVWDGFGTGKLVVKPRTGFSGNGVSLVSSVKELESLMSTCPKQGLVVQPYVEEAAYSDVRAVVVGGMFQYAILRSNKIDFRANVSNGGTAVLIDLPTASKRLACDAAQALGLVFAGVDLTTGVNPRVIEVNTNLGFSQNSKQVTGVDIGLVMAEYVGLKAQEHTG